MQVPPLLRPVWWLERRSPEFEAFEVEGVVTPTDYDTFFEANYWPIVRSLSAAFGGELAVEEAVQEAFVRAYARWRRIRGYESPSAWVRRVAINCIHDQRRALDRRRRAEQQAHRADDVRLADGPRASGDLVGMIESLAPRQRLAMALYYVGDVSVRDIAVTMQISEGAVKAHLSQGRANLAARVQRAPAGRHGREALDG